MEQGMILYQSKYGSTKKYAHWLQESTGFGCMRTADASYKDVLPCTTIVLCGGIYASGIAGLSFLRKNSHKLKDKKIAVFCVGASPYDEKALLQLKEHNFRQDLNGLPLFYGQGAWNEGVMTWKDRTLCKMLQKALAKKDPATYEPWMEGCMASVGQVRDWCDPSYLTPLLTYLQEG